MIRPCSRMSTILYVFSRPGDAFFTEMVISLQTFAKTLHGKIPAATLGRQFDQAILSISKSASISSPG
jgi:hypothetical protein